MVKGSWTSARRRVGKWRKLTLVLWRLTLPRKFLVSPLVTLQPLRPLLLPLVLLLGCLVCSRCLSAEEPTVTVITPTNVASLPDDALLGGSWLTDYATARDRAKQNKQLLFILFYDERRAGLFERLIERLLTDPDVVLLLRPLVKAKLPLSATTVSVQGEMLVVARHPAFRALGEQPGLALIDYRDEDGQQNYRVLSTYSLAGLPRDNIGSGPTIVGWSAIWQSIGQEEWGDVDSPHHLGPGNSAARPGPADERGVWLAPDRQLAPGQLTPGQLISERAARGRGTGRFVARARLGLGLPW
jgi:hypothetical protein